MPKAKAGRSVAIVGVGETRVGVQPGMDVFDLHLTAIDRGLADAGMTLDDIDGIVVTESRSGTIIPGIGSPPYYSDRVPPFHVHGPRMAEYLGLKVRFALTLGLGGAAAAQMIHLAANAIETGSADTILVVSADDMHSGVGTNLAVKHAGESGAHPAYDLPFGVTMPGFHAIIAQRHMYEYGTTAEQLAKVAVTFRKHAQLHDGAHMKASLTIADVLGSRMIADPLHLFDCAPISDGGAAFILTAEDRARDWKKPPVWLLGAAQAQSHMYLHQMESVTSNPGTRMSADRAFSQAGVKREDIDVLMLYDAFSILPIVQLEDLGFCAKGEGGSYVDEVGLGLDSRLPCNTNGGLLSYGHPRRPGIFLNVVEALRQLRGEAGPRSVLDARVSLVLGVSGPMEANNTTMIFGRDEP